MAAFAANFPIYILIYSVIIYYYKLNCFNVITQVIIRATAFSFILFVSSSKRSRNHMGAILQICASVL